MIRLRKARLSAGIVVGVAALVTPLAAISATATTAAAAPVTAPTTYHGTPGAAERLSHAASVSSLAESVTTASGTISHSGVIAAFNGLSNLDSDNLNGFPITPPDQGLCVGRDPT